MEYIEWIKFLELQRWHPVKLPCLSSLSSSELPIFSQMLTNADCMAVKTCGNGSELNS